LISIQTWPPLTCSRLRPEHEQTLEKRPIDDGADFGPESVPPNRESSAVLRLSVLSSSGRAYFAALVTMSLSDVRHTPASRGLQDRFRT
jgi:hypothetical protein